MYKFALQLSFGQTVSLAKVTNGEVVVRSSGVAMTLKRVTPGLLLALQTLSSRAATEDELSELVLNIDGSQALAQLYYYLECFRSQALLCFALNDNDRPLIVVQPIASGFQLKDEDAAEDMRFRLSRFAYCRRDGSNLVLESPLSMARTTICGHLGAALVCELARSRSIVDLCANVQGAEKEMARGFLSLLAAAGVITVENADGTLAEDANPALAQWEFHDFLFHSRNRPGLHDYPVGGTYPFLGEIPALPALKPEMSGEVVSLAVPDLTQLGRQDVSLAQAMEERKSVRMYGGEPINAAQLGEFLYRVARVRRIVGKNPARSQHYESSRRPYPSGGAAYDLELYISVNRCTALARGLYHYEPLDHRLRRLNGGDDYLDALLLHAQRAAVLQVKPQVLITLTSRFQRLSWKYQGLAYATTLKNVGVLFQSMYLVATAMKLAPCALGTGDSSLFAEALGTEYFVESSVGEFVLGSLPSMENGSLPSE